MELALEPDRYVIFYLVLPQRSQTYFQAHDVNHGKLCVIILFGFKSPASSVMQALRENSLTVRAVRCLLTGWRFESAFFHETSAEEALNIKIKLDM